MKAYYESNKASYHTPEMRLVRQIPFADQAKAQEAFDRIQAGASFDEIAKELALSEDDTKLGLVAQDDMADKIIARRVWPGEGSGKPARERQFEHGAAAGAGNPAGKNVSL